MGKEFAASLIQSVGGVGWATNIFQEKHKCFVLVHAYNEIIIDDNNKYFKNGYLNVTVRLISLIKLKYNVDQIRIYGT